MAPMLLLQISAVALQNLAWWLALKPQFSDVSKKSH